MPEAMDTPLDPYRKLAQTLDAMPNGFPATESGVELRLLARIFQPEEAALAAVMRTEWEPADVIAARAGTDPKATYRLLKTMARKGLIYAGRRDRKLAFGLMPFVVGIYEEQITNMDRELAELFEEFYLQGGGGFAGVGPSIHRVIPVEEAVPAGVDIYTYERATDLLESAKAWGVRDCICRTQQKLIGKGCDRPVENCLVFAPAEGIFAHSNSTRAISKEEALGKLAEAAEAGLVHSPGNFQDGNYYICNCCTCCCGVLRYISEFNIPTAIASSGFYAVVEETTCAGCGDCLPRCQFGAMAITDEICQVDASRCVGCGLCVTVCPTGALGLARRPEGEITPPPGTYEDWLAERAQARGMS
jgi:electron transport complex protein RnfB